MRGALKQHRVAFAAGLPLLTAILAVLAAVGLSPGTAQAAPQYSLTCSNCHTMPPRDSANAKKNPFNGAIPGNHQTHASADKSSCSVCHDNGQNPDVANYINSHRNKAIELKAGLNYSRGFVNQTSVPPNPLGTCSNVKCHSNGKGTFKPTPAWGSAPAATDCSTCHDAAPSSNKHTTHIGTYSYSCSQCHTDHSAEANKFAHATSAMWNQPIDVRFSTAPNSGGSFAAGSCSALYCHSDGRGDTKTISWTSGTVTCASCHGDASTLASAQSLSGAHASHTFNNAVLGTSFGCVECHSTTVSDNSTISDRALHVDGTKNTAVACTSCHTDGKGNNKTVAWTDPAMGCAGCHGTTGTFGAPAYASGEAGSATANSHDVHATSAATCANCHSKTTTTGTAILATSQHLDGFLNFTSGNGKTFGKQAAKTCSNISCHGGNGLFVAKNAQWGAQLGCADCHEGATALNTGVHAKHVNATTGKGYGCQVCHSPTVSDSTTISTPANHMNNTPNVALSGGTWTIGDKSCSTSACHGGATPTWNNAASGACGTCHEVTSPLISTNAHEAHFSSTAYGPGYTANVASCQVCHAYTTDIAATHVNGTKNLNGGFNANGTCSTCHAQTTDWTAVGRLSCESCHTTPLSVIGGVTAPDKGLAATAGHGKAGIARSCSACHSNTSAHISGATGDNDRLLGALGTGNTNCTYCHDNSGVVGPEALGMKVHTAIPGRGNKCADCHDVHGTANTMMVKTTINGTAVSFTGNNTFANDGRTGVCQVCHTGSDVTYFTKAGEPVTTHVDSTQNCLECHKHNPGTGLAFAPSGGCNACHGYPPVPRNVAVTFGVQNNWSTARFEDYSGGGGAHTVAAHVPANVRYVAGMTPEAAWAPCLVCHQDGAGAHNRAMPMRNNVGNVTVNVDPQFKFAADYFIVYTSAQLVSGGANKTGSCFNVSCHISPSPKWSTER